MDSGGLKDACIGWGSDLICKEAIIRGKDMPGMPMTLCRELCKNG